MVGKRWLTGDNTERVDTRVLQVIYALDDVDSAVFVGQQVDVFIDASGSSRASAGGVTLGLMRYDGSRISRLTPDSVDEPRQPRNDLR